MLHTLRFKAEQNPCVLILAAHPDDETLGAAGILMASNNVWVAHLADGAPRNRNLWPPGQLGLREDYARQRRLEVEAALDKVHVPAERIVALGSVDQEAVLHLVELTESVMRLLNRVRPELVITHAYEGGHPDHDAAAFVAHRAIDLARRMDKHVPELVEMTLYHGKGGRFTAGEFIVRRNCETMSYTLSDSERELKRAMLREFSSQRSVIVAFDDTCEQFRNAPHYDFSQPPHEGPLYYEQLGWPITGAQWRSCASVARAQLEHLFMSKRALCH